MLAITPERARHQWGENYRISNVIVPLDGSAFPEAAPPCAAALARRMGLAVSLLRVVGLDSIVYSDANWVGGRLGSRWPEHCAHRETFYRDSKIRLRRGTRHDRALNTRVLRCESSYAWRHCQSRGQGVGRPGAGGTTRRACPRAAGVRSAGNVDCGPGTISIDPWIEL